MPTGQLPAPSLEAFDRLCTVKEPGIGRSKENVSQKSAARGGHDMTLDVDLAGISISVEPMASGVQFLVEIFKQDITEQGAQPP
ncbi:hypothetical protein CEK60_00435 [Halomonas sp. N3-2A]|nr:hypothetical protein CEK60_00435 [Halomonas sp. N3-2A]